MGLTLVTGPTAEPLTLAEVKDHLRVDGTDEDALIHALIRSVREHLDGRDGILGRALMTQTWDYTLDRFPVGGIELPLPPIQSVTSITYTDADGAEQTFEDFHLGNNTHWHPNIYLSYGASWPTTRCIQDAVTVRYVAGYGDQNAVPHSIRAAMLLMIGHLFANREAINIGNIVNVLPMGVDALLSPYRLLTF